MKKNILTILSIIFILSLFSNLYADETKNSITKELPLKRVALFSSGVAYYEHEGEVNNSEEFDFVFSAKQVSDVLKSIAVHDSGAKKIELKYDSSNTLRKTLESLSVDLSRGHDIQSILKNQIGAELIIFTPEKITGKIIGVTKMDNIAEPHIYLNLMTESGIKMINLTKIKEFKFADPKKNKDLNRALTLLADSNNQKYKTLRLELKGDQKRKIKVAYVMESAVWKSTYRLNLGNKQAVFQAWAIVDNSTNFDWKNVELSLVSGKPISFKQNLFDPFFVNRVELPLSIAGSADVAVYDDAMNNESEYEEADEVYKYEPAPKAMMKRKNNYAPSILEANKKVFSAKNSSLSGERFVFSPAMPINLERQKSMMIPLKVTTLPMEKFSVFSNMPYRQSVNPKLCIKIKNTSGLKLPAGPITIYDRGYSGDALIEFFPDNAERLIAYGDDLLLQGSNTENSVRNIEKVKMYKGNMEIEYSTIYTKNYTIKNSGKEKRNIIIEHNMRSGTELYNTEKPAEKTASLYRFKTVAPGNKTIEFKVSEKRINKSIYSIHNFSESQIIQYSNNSEMPNEARKIFKSIISERIKLNQAKKFLNNLEEKQEQLNREQERTRKNLEAVSKTSNTDRFMQKLINIENKLENLKQEIDKAKTNYQKANNKYHEFIESIEL